MMASEQPLVSLIVALDRRGLIGVAGRLPWHLPAEMRWFQQMTRGKMVLMGRRTYETIGRPLARRRNVVLTRQPDYVAPGCLIAHTLAEALSMAAEEAELMVIGGAELYRQTLPLAQRLYVSVVEAVLAGDVRFPVVDWAAWQVTWQTAHPADAAHAYAFRSYILARRPPA